MNGLPPLFWTALPVSVIAFPLLVMLALVLVGARGSRFIAPIAPWTPLPGLAYALFALGTPDVVSPYILLGATLGLTEFARIFLLFTSLLWWLAGLHAWGYIASERRREFFAFFLAAMAGNLGLLIARDIASFYTLYALMSFASYGLVIHTRSESARRAGDIYLILVVIGEILIFPALVMGYAASGQLLIADWAAALPLAPGNEGIAALLLLGFGIKAGMPPLHVWLPLAHPAAPTPASAVLSGAMIKAGLFGMVVFLPLGAWQSVNLGVAVMALSLIAALFAALIALGQEHPKALLAYSSISKMGPMTFALGATLYEPSLWPAAATCILIFATYHGLTKGALFLSVGTPSAFPSAKPARNALMLAGLLPLLVFAGFPVTAGAIAKYPFKTLKKGLAAPWDAWLDGTLLAVAVVTVLLLFRFGFLLLRDEKTATQKPSWRIWLPWLAIVAVATAAPVAYPGLGWEKYVNAVLSPKSWVAALPPLVLGSVLGAVVPLAASRRGRGRIPTVPAGDILVLYQALLRLLGRLIPQSMARLVTRPTSSAQPLVSGAARLLRRWLPVRPFLDGSSKVEQWLLEGPLAGTLLFLLFLAMVGTMLV